MTKISNILPARQAFAQKNESTKKRVPFGSMEKSEVDETLKRMAPDAISGAVIGLAVAIITGKQLPGKLFLALEGALVGVATPKLTELAKKGYEKASNFVNKVRDKAPKAEPDILQEENLLK